MASREELLQKQTDFESSFNTWFESGLKDILLDNRRRYRMELEDKEERIERGLSALPSTKSTSVVDKAVERALIDYHSDPDSISFTAKAVNDPIKDILANVLTKDFEYRRENTFPFFTWHTSSLTAAFADGLEAAMVWWKKEAYKQKRTKYIEPLSGTEVTEEELESIKAQVGEDVAGLIEEEEINDEVVTTDTWWIDQLKPGEQLLWDFKSPLLNLNLGQVCLVKVFKTLDEIKSLSKQGIFNKVKETDILPYLKAETLSYDTTSTVGNPESSDLGDYNRAEVWYFFYKENNRWMVSFSIAGKLALSSGVPVDDVFFNGRNVNKLPVVLGTSKMKLWENVGRGLPETIAPIEDEWTDHRNNINDAAKISIQGRVRITPGADINLDDVLNAKAFYAEQTDVEFIDRAMNLADSVRAADSIAADMNELIPAGMESRNLVPKGTNKTLGAVQMAASNSQEKLSVQLMVRNETFFKPLLWLIAQLTFSYESDDTIMMIAAQNAGADVRSLGLVTLVDGKPGFDFSKFDFDVNIKINAGLGSVPRQQKLQNMLQIYQLAKMLGFNLDGADILKRANVLAGFDAAQFNPQPQAPPPPEVDYKLNITCTLGELAMIDPSIVAALAQKYKEGQFSVSTTVKEDPEAAMREQLHNGGLRQTGDMPMQDMSQGDAAMGMSQGGMNS